MNKLLRIMCLLVFLLYFTLIGYTQELPTVKIVEVKNMEFKRVFNFTADAVALKVVDIYSRVQNRILKKLYVDVGDRVKDGQVLALLDDEYAKVTYQGALAGVKQAEASVEQARVVADNAKDNYLRLKELYEKKIVSKQAFDNAKAQYEQALASLKLAQEKLKYAKASLSEAELLLSYHKIVSPTDGVIIKKFMDEGTMIIGSTPILRIIQDNPVKVQGVLPQEALSYIRIGDEIEVYSDVYPGKVFKGRLKVISPVIDSSTRTFSVEAWIDNSEYLLKVGMFLRAKLVAGSRRVLAVPLECVTSLNQVFVYSDGAVFERRIVLGEAQDRYVEVISGLKEREKVVFQPTAWLKNGMRVKVVE
ncbi:MAG: efflux RND transporter periplasmic adaptor subunit [Synergistetes bacterium]|nr:efflux RND transporter periplasmic adaptor subunit [Synergistota bacterium]MCX8128027.1 efflux RND transporter periplasmic adaptor subunit [Synergistota bacterium]MDW8193065.1 efflux RND transporter periplasmic adaptor subunit [Synergistota bacterium]